ncbi:aldo/keto reductase [Synechococcus sp. RSCCF101]|uniref:aldo/keto reductase n=1 Tax=Synechococcus sp. RSCCF101 TaxID=2511069 RepID=UPI001244F4F1|nr:aldo/keto reductase [Synechococcus sp. RSCCF101]QEY33029.1 aldo/keto reductase [Synechococcus sp. RSCCF101]
MLSIGSAAVQRIGYGAMGLEGYYGPSDRDTALETLIGEAIRQSGRDACVATKLGIVFEPDQSGSQLDTGWGFPLTINGSTAYVSRAIDNSLQRLRLEAIDLLYAHDPDPGTPLEETVAAMGAAVAAGKVKAIGLSNVTAEQVLQAHAVHPIAAVQYEYSLFRREAEQSLLPAIRSISALMVCWSPLGAGVLTGQLPELTSEDFRRFNPKLQDENLSANRERLEGIQALARRLAITPAQLALAWLLAQGDTILPIPGTRHASRIDENLAALTVQLSEADLRELDALAPVGAFRGATLV